MKLREIIPGFNINQRYSNPQFIKLTADKMELEFMEATNVKAYVSDKNDNPVSNANVSWSTSEKSDIGSVTTNNRGIATKRILKTRSSDLIVTAKCNDLNSSIILKKQKIRF